MPTLVFPSLVRDQILEQHAELRGLLEEALTSCEGVPAPDEDQLAAQARELCGRFCAHLAFEEEALRPVLAVLDSWGPERVRNLHDEHTRQRLEMNELLARFETRRDVVQLAAALRELARELLDDMEREEQGLLRAQDMSAGHLTIERR